MLASEVVCNRTTLERIYTYAEGVVRGTVDLDVRMDTSLVSVQVQSDVNLHNRDPCVFARTHVVDLEDVCSLVRPSATGRDGLRYLWSHIFVIVVVQDPEGGGNISPVGGQPRWGVRHYILT